MLLTQGPPCWVRIPTIRSCIWAPSSKFVSSSIPSWQILTGHAQPFRGAKDLAFCLKVPLDSLLGWASSGGSGETARMRRLAWTFAARISDKYQIRLTRPILWRNITSTSVRPRKLNRWRTAPESIIRSFNWASSWDYETSHRRPAKAQASLRGQSLHKEWK